MGRANRVKFGLKNVHYAKATIGSDGSATFDAPVPIPGAVSLSLEPQGDTNKFYADNIVYFTTTSNAGYEGDLEVAVIPDTFRKDILKEEVDDKGVQFEDVGADTIPFALLFQVEGDVKARRYVFYNNVATRTTEGGATKEDTTEPQTETLSMTSGSIYVAGLDKDIAKAKTTPDTDAEVFANWFNEVYVPANTTADTDPSDDDDDTMP